MGERKGGEIMGKRERAIDRERKREDIHLHRTTIGSEM